MGTNYTLVNKTSGELTLVSGDVTLRLGETAGYIIFVSASSFVLFNLLRISLINSFNPFQATDFVEPLEEVSPEHMEEEFAADAMAALSLSGAMSSGHSKKKKKKKRK